MSSKPVSHAQAERFKTLAWPMLPVVLRSAQYLTRNTQEAEDLAQETMIKAMRAIDSYRDGTNMKAWLLTILRRTQIDRIRSQASRPREVPLEESMFQTDTEFTAHIGEHDDQWREPEALMNRFDDQAVIEALQALPDDMRWTLLLVDVEQMDHVQAASVLGVALGTIKSRAHRARAQLRDKLYQLAVHRGWIETEEATR